VSSFGATVTILASSVEAAMRFVQQNLYLRSFRSNLKLQNFLRVRLLEVQMKKTTLALAFTFAMAAPVFAGNCPVLMGQFEEALQTTTVDDATKASAVELYETGKAAHDAGDHAASMTALDSALALLAS
jgi:hypothetical protein